MDEVRHPATTVTLDPLEDTGQPGPGSQDKEYTTVSKQEYYDRQFTGNHDSPIRTAVVKDGKVTDSFVWKPNGNLRGFDGPDPDECETVDDLRRAGYKKRR